ncbi:hypothetical protein B4Q13_22025, partial [Lacticaseibacillus rhamnosus]
YNRKIREMIVATRLESSLTKDEILELYLNCVFLGRSAWGVEVAAPQAGDDLDPLEGLDVAVHVAHLHPQLGEVLRQLLGHPLGQGGDQDPLLALDDFADLPHQVVDLAAG